MSKTILLALDSYYKDDICNTSLVIFDKDESIPIYQDTIYTKVTSKYVPGEFYKRELPGIKKILKKLIKEHPDLWSSVHAIIVDGYIKLKNGDKEWDGLGGHLWNYLTKIGQHKIVYGIAKSKFGDCDKISYQIFRGKSKNPLYVQTTAAPIIVLYTVQDMPGKYRIPTMLKFVDTLSKIFPNNNG